MNEPKPFASLGPTLLARKGGAKPAMRPQLAPMGMGGSGGASQSAAALKQDAKLARLLREAVEAASDDEGWAGLGAVGSLISKQAPDFDSRNYGFRKLSDLVTAAGLFETDERKSADGRQKTLFLRDKRKKR